MIIKQGTNYTRTFLMVQSADHITGITSGTPAVTISKAGGAFGAAANSPATFVGNGLCSIALTIVDTNTPGELAFHCSLAAADPTDFIDQVQAPVITDLSLDANGNINVTSNIKKNQARPGFMFVMTAGSPGTPTPLLTVSGFRAFDGGSFAPCSSSVTEMANGWYTINLAAADTNCNNLALRFTAPGANDLNMGFLTQP